MRVLIVVEDYPSDTSRYPMAYVHSRVLQYKKHFSVEVLSFSATCEYFYEGVKVMPEKSCELTSYIKIVSHAPNLKNHVKFFLRNKVSDVIFFIHGHEVLEFNKYYPKPYSWSFNNYFKAFLFFFYDKVKLSFMSRFFQCSSKFKFVFVSQWMMDEGIKSLKLSKLDNSFVIYNPINSFYVDNRFDFAKPKKFDFVTVRPFDGPKYCVDLLVKAAEAHTELQFLLIGKGRYFEFNKKPDNLTIIDGFLPPEKLAFYLNESKCAFMPTRLDAQGVMMCEMASYGMPIITSDIDIAKEVFRGYEAAAFVSNSFQEFDTTLDSALVSVSKYFLRENDCNVLLERFSLENTIFKEINVIRGLL